MGFRKQVFPAVKREEDTLELVFRGPLEEARGTDTHRRSSENHRIYKYSVHTEKPLKGNHFWWCMGSYFKKNENSLSYAHNHFPFDPVSIMVSLLHILISL